MSLKQVTVSCDWPECQKRLTADVYTAFLHDHGWAAVGESYLESWHLCPEHRQRTLVELAAALRKQAKATDRKMRRL